jgi:hypothetical protein
MKICREILLIFGSLASYASHSKKINEKCPTIRDPAADRAASMIVFPKGKEG